MFKTYRRIKTTFAAFRAELRALEAAAMALVQAIDAHTAMFASLYLEVQAIRTAVEYTAKATKLDRAAHGRPEVL